MARKATSPTQLQEQWESRIKRALAKRKKWAEQFRVDMARAYFEGKQNPGWDSDEWITLNKVYTHLMAQLPFLYSVDPYFHVGLKRSWAQGSTVQERGDQVANMEAKGKVRASYLNYLKVELKLKEQARLGIQDAHFAYGVLKAHYSADQQDNPDAGLPIRDDDGNEMFVDDEMLIEPETIPVNEQYHWRRVHPDDFVWDENAGPLEGEWPFVAERTMMSKDEAKKDKRLKSRIIEAAPTQQRSKVRKKEGEAETAAGDNNADKKLHGEVVVLWEIYDLKENQWLILLEDANQLVMDPSDLPPGVEDHPYSVLRFTLRDDNPYPITPVSQGLDPQKELNLSRSSIVRHRKRFNRKYELNMANLADESEAEKLESGDDGTIIRTNGSGQAVFPIADAPMNYQTYTELQLLNNDLVEALGAPGESRGLASADTATQASIIDQRLEVREGDRLALVVDWVAESAKKMDQLAQVHMSRDEAVKVTGPQGEAWEEVGPGAYQDIEGEYEYTVEVGSTLPRIPQIERTQLLALLQVLAQFPHLMTSRAMMKHLASLHRIDNDAIIEELMAIGGQIMGGQQPMPGGGGGAQAGVPQDNPITGELGKILGNLGGVSNGGGAPEATGQ